MQTPISTSVWYNRAPFKNNDLMRQFSFRACRFLALLGLAVVSGGCATRARIYATDPLEPANRSIYQFNERFDRVLLAPAATLYQTVTPPPVRGGVSNFFGNFRDVTTTVNDLLQFKISDAFSDAGRVLVNSTIGIFGIFDVATRIGLKKHNEDFGQTLAPWGTPDGPFLVLPILGPSTTRDAVGLIGDYVTDPEFSLFTESPANSIVFVTRIVSVGPTCSTPRRSSTPLHRPLRFPARCVSPAPA